MSEKEQNVGRTLYRSDRGTEGRVIMFTYKCNKDYHKAMDANTTSLEVSCTVCGMKIGEIV